MPLLLEHLPVTLTETLVGLGISIILGALLAMVMHLFPTANRTVYPLIVASQTIPIIALSPIFLFWFGYSLAQKVAVVVLITGEEMARKDPATVQAFWRALAKGHGWVKSHQADALKLLLAKQEKSFPLDAKVEEAGTPFGAQSADDWAKVAAWLKEHGAVKADVNPADAFVSIIK